MLNILDLWKCLRDCGAPRPTTVRADVAAEVVTNMMLSTTKAALYGREEERRVLYNNILGLFEELSDESIPVS